MHGATPPYAVHNVEELIPWVTKQKVKYFQRDERGYLVAATSNTNKQAEVHKEIKAKISTLTMEGVENYSSYSRNYHDSSITMITYTFLE